MGIDTDAGADQIVWPNDDLKRHLDGPGPKRILALDGGGVRGILSVGILERIEALLQEQSGRGDDFVLSDYFDLIAGTSTGSIIATLLALGKRVSEVETFYRKMAPEVFASRRWLPVFKPKFRAKHFEALLFETLGDMTLGSKDLKTGLIICAKRMDTGSQWVLTNDPRNKFYAPKDRGTTPNRDYPLRNVLRASTAAPFYFHPQEITIADEPGFPKLVGTFVDGGVGGDNNPSLQAFKSATLNGYRMKWETGKDKLLLVSVGTGWRRPLIDIDEFRKRSNVWKTKEALTGMVLESVQSHIVTLQALAHVPKPRRINSELLDMRGMSWVAEPLLTFHRFDASLEDDDVVSALNLQGRAARKVKCITKRMLQLDNASKKNLANLYNVGKASSRARDGKWPGIDAADFPDAFRI